MAWGSFLGKLGTVAGVPGADIIGSGIDAYSDYERLRADKAYRQFTMNEQVKRDQFMMENYVRDKAEQKAIRDDLILILHILMKKPRAIRGDLKKDNSESNL